MHYESVQSIECVGWRPDFCLIFLIVPNETRIHIIPWILSKDVVLAEQY